MTTEAPERDPLETYESLPAVSFHEPNGGYAKGVWVKLEVRDWPKLLEQKDEDGNIERWDNGDAKLVLVVPVFDGVDEDGKRVEKNLWAKKFGKKATGSIFQQLAAAQAKVRKDEGDPEYRLGPGDTLAVKYVDDDRSVKPIKGNYPKIYQAVIKPGQRPAPSNDPFDEPASPVGSPEPNTEDPWGADPSGRLDADNGSTPQQGQRLQPGGDPFGDAAPDDEPPF